MTADPYNYILDSLKTHLTNNVTDPRTGRNANCPLVIIGELDKNTQVQYPVIKLSSDNASSVLASNNGEINSTQSALTIQNTIMIDIITDRNVKYDSKWRGELCRNLASQVLNALSKKSQMQTLKSSYDIQHVSQITGFPNPIFMPETSEFHCPGVFNFEFLYIY
jgi:hypothetical protein